MPAYAYKVSINYEREKVWTHHEKELENYRLTIRELEEIVGENVFHIGESEGQFSNGYTVYWSTSHDETDEEYNTRITRLEKYNAEVDRRKSQK